jgi:hypothetical protein
MRQSIAILSLLSGAVMAADTIPFYFPGGPTGELNTSSTLSIIPH